MSTSGVIGVIAVLVAVSLAGASLECTLPGITPEGCVHCYSCRVEKETVTSVEEVPFQVIDLDKCRGTFGGWVTEALCESFGKYGYDVYRTEIKEVTVTNVAQEKCVCDPTPIAMDCLDPADATVFTLECPTNKTFNGGITICRWNLPQADQVYMHVLKKDIEGNPNDDDVGCMDKLVVRCEDWTEDLVTCGSLPTTRPAARIYNSICSKDPDVLFYSENGMEGCCFRILVCLEKRKDTVGGMIATSTDVTVDTGASPMATPSTACCTCPEISLESLLSKNCLANPFIQRLQDLMDSNRTCPGIGETGFSGLKGCIGAEFLTCGTPPCNLTEEQCMKTRLGMTDMEEKVFLSSQGGSLWCGCNPETMGGSSRAFCEGDAATRPDAKELVKLEQLVEGRGDVDECARSDNDILQKVALFLTDNNNTIPALVPCPKE